jgi:hypothetical protein
LIASSLGKYFHAAVGIVAHPPRNAQDVSFALYKPAKTHSLHTSPHHEAASLNCIFCGSHAKKLLIDDF